MEFIIENLHGESVLWNIIILVILVDLRSFFLPQFVWCSFVAHGFVTAPFCPVLFWQHANVGALLSCALLLLHPSEVPQKHWHHGHNNKKCLKHHQSHFYQAIPHKSHHFSLFWCILCMATPDISSLSENINSTARVSRLSFHFLWSLPLFIQRGLWNYSICLLGQTLLGAIFVMNTNQVVRPFSTLLKQYPSKED